MPARPRTGKPRLELTWVGKDRRPKLEPRVLLEDPAKGHHAAGRRDGDLFDNRLIKGDNLLALKALEAEFAGQVKCVYIDPPFNTGAAFEHYDDGLEHSLWLDLLYQRVELLHRMLEPEGSMFVHLDDNEADYFRVAADEIFGRRNFISRITVDARSPSAFSTVNSGVFKASEYILWFARDKEAFTEGEVRVKRTPDYAYSKWLENPEENCAEWQFRSVLDAYEEHGRSTARRPDTQLEHFHRFQVQHADHFCRFASISDSGAGKHIVAVKKQSLGDPDRIFHIPREEKDDIYILNGQQVIFYGKNVHEIDGEPTATAPLTNVWTDIS